MNLVTGGTGLVGSFLLRKLLEKGEKVRAIRRKDSPTAVSADLREHVEWVEGDVLDIFSLTDAMEGVDKAYHCAGLVSFDPGKKGQLDKINVEGTANFINAAIDSRVRKILHVSSVAAIGRRGEKLTDESGWDPETLSSYYGLSKFRAEREAWRGMAEGLDVVVVNPSIVLGPGHWEKGSSSLFSKVFNGLKFYTEGVAGFVDVRDLSDIMYQLMEKEISGERYIINSENRKLYEVFEMIARELNVPPPSIRAGKLMRELAWRWEHFKTRFSGREPLITRETARSASKKRYFDNSKIRETLDYSFVPVEESVTHTSREFLKDRKK